MPLPDDVRELLERLAPEEPMNQDEQGGCVWCDGTGGTPYGYAGTDPSDHAPDCPWVEARRLLGADVPTAHG